VREDIEPEELREAARDEVQAIASRRAGLARMVLLMEIMGASACKRSGEAPPPPAVLYQKAR